jgi:GTPase SAR1 family protein
MARIGIIGAQGVGKSTLINALMKEPMFSKYESLTSPTRLLKTRFGLDLENANTDLQLATLALQMRMLEFPDVIVDRTVVDNYAYLLYYTERGKSDLSNNMFKFILMYTSLMTWKIDIFFFLKKEFELIPDGVRVVDTDQQKEIEEKINSLIHQFNLSNRTFVIRGSLEERVSIIKEVCKDFI